MTGLKFVQAYQKLAKHVIHKVSMRQPKYFLDELDFEFSLSVHNSGSIIATPTLLTAENTLIEFESVIITMAELNEMCK